MIHVIWFGQEMTILKCVAYMHSGKFINNFFARVDIRRKYALFLRSERSVCNEETEGQIAHYKYCRYSLDQSFERNIPFLPFGIFWRK